MKKIVALLCVFFALPVLVYANEVEGSGGKNTQVLFVLLSKEASIKKTNEAGVYTLSLKGVNPKIIYFSNRPERISGQMATTKFIAQWQDKGVFSKDAPNAVIETVRLGTGNKLQNTESSYAVVLEEPAYGAKSDGEVTFKIKALPDKKALMPKLGKSDYVAIFIDDICLSCMA